jgi:aminopeptidase N
LSQIATKDEQLELLRSAGDDDVDVAWRTLTRRASLGKFDPDEVAQLVQRDPDPEAWSRAVAVQAAQPIDEAKDGAWRQAFDDHFPLTSLRGMGQAFWQPGQHEVLAPYADRFLQELPRISGQGMLSGITRVSTMFPYFGVDSAFVTRVEAAADESGTTPLLRARLLECADRLARMLRARAT